MKRIKSFFYERFISVVFVTFIFQGATFSLIAENEPNNTYQTSDTLLLSVANTGVVDNSADKIDWWILPNASGTYKVRFKTDKKVTFTLYGNNPAKSVTSFTLSTIPDTAFVFSYSGSQYIRVNGASSETNYSLTVDFVNPMILPDDLEPNNDTINSIPLQFGEFKEGNIGYINSTLDIVDYYSVTLPEDGFVRITVIYNDNIVVNPLFNGITNAFHKGKYHFAVFPPSNIGDKCHYKIKAEFEPINEYANDAEPNDEIAQAKTVDIRNDITGKVCLMLNAKKMDAQDLYTFTLEKDTTLTLRFLQDKFLDSSFILYLENSYNYIYPDKNGIVSRNFAAGKYYIKVFSTTYKGGSYRITSKNTDAIPISIFDHHAVGNKVFFTEKVNVPCNFKWEFGDGVTSESANPEHTYNSTGEFQVTLTAWNEAGKHIVKKQIFSNGITDFYPVSGGNNGYVTMRINGRGFKSNSVVKLSSSNGDIFADSVYLESNYCLFDLHDKPLGNYSLIVSAPDAVYEAPTQFSIVGGQAPQINASIVGRDVFRKGTQTNYTLSLSNSGKVDALGVPLYIAITEDAVLNFNDLKIVLSKYAIDRNIKFDTVPVFVNVDKVLGEEFKAKVYALYIHNLPAGKTINRRISIKSDNDIKILIWTNKPYFGSPMRGEVADCMLDATAEAMTDQLIGLIPGASCAKSIYENVVEPVFTDEESSEESSVGSMVWDFATMAWDCATSFFTPAKAIDFAVSLVTTIVDVSGYSDKMQDCYKAEGKNGNSLKSVVSLDPNEKNGLRGYGEENHIFQTNNLPYRIDFENKSTATAPAQEVFVTDTLDNNVFNLEKFNLTAFGFGDTIVYFNGFNQNLIHDVDLRPRENLIVRFAGNLDCNTGVAKWTFRSFNPQTMDLPEDPLAGFLPPNNENRAGEGFVSFTIDLKDNVGENMLIANKASIVFDRNEPIITNEFVNKLDFSTPISKINSQKGAQLNDYRLEFSGNDSGAGIQYYRVYVSVNDSAYKLLKTTSTPIEKFTVEKGTNVKLYSLAVDSLGWTETKTEIPDITLSYFTGIEQNNVSPDIYIYPQPVNNFLYIAKKYDISENMKVEIFDICGKSLLKSDLYSNNSQNDIAIDVSLLNSGLYLLVINDLSGTKRMTFIKH